MREENYTQLKMAVEVAGFHTTFHPDGDGEVCIVLVSSCTEGRLHGNSFRVWLKAGRWYLVTWLTVMYLVPPHADLTALCLECLRASHSPFPEVPSDIASRYGLLEVSEANYDQA